MKQALEEMEKCLMEVRQTYDDAKNVWAEEKMMSTQVKLNYWILVCIYYLPGIILYIHPFTYLQYHQVSLQYINVNHEQKIYPSFYCRYYNSSNNSVDYNLYVHSQKFSGILWNFRFFLGPDPIAFYFFPWHRVQDFQVFFNFQPSPL